MPLTERDGVSLYFKDTGEGHAILFLHEFGGDVRSWQHQVRYFSRRYRCIVTAARGYPPSDVPVDADDYGWETSLADAVHVLDHLNIERAHVVGLSMGAYMGLMLAMRHGDRVSALAAASGGSGAYLPTREGFIADALASAERMQAAGALPAEGMGMAPNRVQLKIKDPLGWQEFVDHLADHSAVGSAHTMRAVQAARPSLYDFDTELAAIAAPTLLVVGDEDDPCLDVNLHMKRIKPMAGMSVFPKSGHLLNLEDPARFNGELENFFIAAEAGRWPVRDMDADPAQVFDRD
ncbi:MAG: alpha/beta hydrolase [Rhodospirillaceae bacterium]|jgi:pimeloyl-ACP methyl ester carboxylesterase|nr:alpha/beta hydrolase [Rhodospirillaceae bacterium]